MGKISQGILGGFSGKVGNVVGGSWKGIDYMRVKPASVANPQTEAQMNQRAKFSTVLGFLQPIGDFIKVGFKNYAIKMTAFNSAMSYNLKNALTGDYPDYTIDYTKALVSRGSLAGALNPAAAQTGSNEITFTWDNNSSEGNASVDDTAMVLILNSTKGEAIFITEGSTRTTGEQVMTIPTNFAGDTLKCFIAFKSQSGDVSNSKNVELAGGIPMP